MMTDSILSGPHQKFCEAVVSGMNGTEAYLAAYPRVKRRESANSNASVLMAQPAIQAEIGRLRAVAETRAGSAVMTLVEKRSFLARLVRARPALLEEDSDLWQSIKHTKLGVEFRLPDKLAAIARDNDLAGEGADAGMDDALAALLRRVRK